MEASPSYFDPEDLSIREQFRRYGKRHSGSSLSPQHDSAASKLSEIRSNAALFLEDIKQEVEGLDMDDGGTPPYTQTFSKRRSITDGQGPSEPEFGTGIRSLKTLKQEEDGLIDSGDTTFSLFASLLDSALQGLMTIPDLILRFESACREVSESMRSGSNERLRIVEDKLMRQKARLLLDEAASWSLLWYLYGKGNKSLAFLCYMLVQSVVEHFVVNRLLVFRFALCTLELYIGY